MFKLLTNKKKIILTFLVGVGILITLPGLALAVDGPIATEGYSVSFSAGTDLPTIPAATGIMAPRPSTEAELTQRSNNDQTQIDNLLQLKKQLSIASEQSFLKNAKTGAVVGAANGYTYGGVIGTGIGAVRGFFLYNSQRKNSIALLDKNADAKIGALKDDQGACLDKISDITKEAALAAGDQVALQAALNKADQAKQKMAQSRAAYNKAVAQFKTVNSLACSVNNLGNCVLEVTSWIGNIVTYVFALLLWASSGIFDIVVNFSILNIGTWFKLPLVASAWRLMRDFANIFFVFVLLYIAIGTIFDLKGVGQGLQKTIVGVIVIALLVNFSGFFVRVVVDASNIIAYEFYSGIKKGDSTFSLGTNLVQKMDLGARFIDPSSLEDAKAQAGGVFNNSPIPEEGAVDKLSFLSIIAGTFGNILIILATSFVLLTAAILFIIRTITLLFIYIIAPFAFVSKIIPIKSFNKFDKWSDTLIKQSFFAPAFLIPLYLVFLILGPTGISHLASTAKGTEGWAFIGQDSLLLVMADVFILGLIIACIFIAQSLSAIGLGFATGVAGKANALGVRNIGRFVGRPVATVAGKLGGNRLITEAKWAASKTRVTKVWNSASMKEIRETKFGKKLGQAIKNPMLSANDALGSAAGLAGVKSFNVLGSSAESRKDAAKAEKEKKEEDEKRKKEDREKALKTASTAEALTILGGMTDGEIKDLPADIITLPAISLNLENDQLVAINKAGKLTKDHKKAVKQIIMGIAPKGIPGTMGTPEGQIFMMTGAGASWPR